MHVDEQWQQHLRALQHLTAADERLGTEAAAAAPATAAAAAAAAATATAATAGAAAATAATAGAAAATAATAGAAAATAATAGAAAAATAATAATAGANSSLDEGPSVRSVAHQRSWLCCGQGLLGDGAVAFV